MSEITDLAPFGLDIFRGKFSGSEDDTLASLPSVYSNITSTYVNKPTINGATFMSKIEYKGSNIVGLKSFYYFLWHDGLSHSGSSNGNDSVNFDVSFFTFLSEGLTESMDSHFSCCIVDLSERAIIP